MKNETILSVNNLVKYFTTPQGTLKAVDGVSFSIKESEIFGIIGESGSGKSTIAYLLSGIYEITSGEILYKSNDISMNVFRRPKNLKKEIQIVFQDPGTSLNPSRTVKQILELPMKIHKIGKGSKERYCKIIELLEKGQLPIEYLNKYPGMLGGGEKQLVNILRALSTNPSFLILDEPTSALDVSIQAKIINMILNFQKEMNLSYIFITHDLILMRNVSHTVAIMYLGKFCEIAPTNVFFKNPLHPYTQMLLSAIPVVSDEEEKLKPKKIISKGEIPSPINIPPGCSFKYRCPKKIDVCDYIDPIFIEVEKNHFVRCNLFTK